MVFGFVDILGRLCLIRQHAFVVQITGTGNQILFVGIFSCKTVSDQMAAVVQIVSVYHAAVFDRMPARRPDLSDFPALFSRHGINAYIDIGDTAASEFIKFMIRLKTFGVLLFPRSKIGLVAVYNNRSFSVVFWYFIE